MSKMTWAKLCTLILYLSLPLIYHVSRVSTYTNCESLQVEKICNLPNDFLTTVDTKFYTKFVMANGIPVLSSDNSPDYSLVETARVVSAMMERLRPEIAQSLIRRQQRIIVYGVNENSCSLPEQSGPACKPSKGLGLSYSNIVSIPYLREKCEDRGHGPYIFLLHEFGHAVNSVFYEVDKQLQVELDEAYEYARKNRIWPPNTYGMVNVAEYFPLCWTPLWFKVNHKCQQDASFCSPDKCSQRDPRLFALIRSLLKDVHGNYLNLECSQKCHPQKISNYSVEDECQNSAFETLKLQNIATGTYLDSNVRGESYLLPENSGFYQKWKVSLPRTIGSMVQILNLATGLALETDTNGKVYTSVWNKESIKQKWKFVDNVTVQNVATGRILDATLQGSVYTLPKNDGHFQHWNVK